MSQISVVNILPPKGMPEIEYPSTKLEEYIYLDTLAFRAFFAAERSDDFSVFDFDEGFYYTKHRGSWIKSKDGKFDLCFSEFRLRLSRENRTEPFKGGDATVWIIIGISDIVLKNNTKRYSEVLGLSKPHFGDCDDIFEWLQDEGNWQFLKEVSDEQKVEEVL